MSKSVRERAQREGFSVYLKEAKSHGNVVQGAAFNAAIDHLAAAGLLATDALLECGDACIAHFKQYPDSDSSYGRSPGNGCVMSTKAGRALAAERAGKPGVTKPTDPAPSGIAAKPDTSREDEALYEAVARHDASDFSDWEIDVRPALAACRKAREPKPRHTAEMHRDGWWGVKRGKEWIATGVHIQLAEAECNAMSEALNSLDAKERAK